MTKTARQGTVEIVRTISSEEWVTLLNESLAAVAEAAAAMQEAAQTVTEAVETFRKRWSEINFTG